MVRLTAEFKRMALRGLYLSLPQQGVIPPSPGGTTMKLIDALNALTVNAWGGVKSGRTITAVSGSGRSTQFMPPAVWQSLSQENCAALSEELQQIYADTLVNMTTYLPPVTPADDGGSGTTAIFNAMLNDDRLDEVTVTRKDYTALLIPFR